MSIYKATYGILKEAIEIDKINMGTVQDAFNIDSQDADYVGEFDEDDMEASASAQDIAGMAAEQHSGENIDELAYGLGYNKIFKDGQQTSSEGEVLIDAIKTALENNQISFTNISDKYKRGESIIQDIDFMNYL
jgi:hypothetical protein